MGDLKKLVDVLNLHFFYYYNIIIDMRKLTDNMNAFCELYVKYEFNGTKAYQEAYKQDNKEVAAVEASGLLKDSRITKRINEVEGDYRITGHKVGVNKKLIMEKIKLMLEAKTPIYFQGSFIAEKDDTGAINNAIQTYAKLVGDFAPEKIDLNLDDDINDNDIDITKLTKEEINNLKERLLKSM